MGNRLPGQSVIVDLDDARFAAGNIIFVLHMHLSMASPVPFSPWLYRVSISSW
jgi:hypothetical protein